MAECQVEEVDWLRERYEELALMDERRLKALYHVKGYQRRVARAYNKKVSPIKQGRLLRETMCLKSFVCPSLTLPRGASSNLHWVGPYIVKPFLSGGAAYLMDLDGNEFKEPVNLDQLITTPSVFEPFPELRLT